MKEISLLPNSSILDNFNNNVILLGLLKVNDVNNMNYYSQFGQDEWLYNQFYKNKIDGVFLEIGADDGIDKSNTKFFEDLGWTGLCIEPSPDRFSKLINNRKCICENIAVFDKECEIDFLDISGWGKGLSGIKNMLQE